MLSRAAQGTAGKRFPGGANGGGGGGREPRRRRPRQGGGGPGSVVLVRPGRPEYHIQVGALVADGELQQVLGVLAGVSIVPVLFKGAALAHTAYASSACRPRST